MTGARRPSVSTGPEYVLDASALIALVRREPGWEKVAEIIDRSTISAVNLAEAVAKLIQKGGAREAVERVLDGLRLNVADWTERLAYDSAEFAPLAWERGLSLGDRACLTLARRKEAIAVTADHSWEGLPVTVLTIR